MTLFNSVRLWLSSRSKLRTKKIYQRYPCSAYNILTSHLSPDALAVVKELRNNGFIAYIVGGSVRDLLLQKTPKDFDIATNAKPEQIRKLFRKARIIGKRFPIVHIPFDRHIIEVTTFRASQKPIEAHHLTAEHMLAVDKKYGRIDEDALRRDFTINALYLDPEAMEIIDYVGGMDDLKNRNLRIIGVPNVRFHEDPVRMLRAVRFATKTDFSIDAALQNSILQNAELLQHIPPMRLYEESLKLFLHGHAAENFEKLLDFGLFSMLFPKTAATLADTSRPHFVDSILQNTDLRIAANKTVNPAFLYLGLLWPAIEKRSLEQGEDDKRIGLITAFEEVFYTNLKHVGILRRFHDTCRDIVILQKKMQRRSAKELFTIIEHPKFRAAFDFLMIRSEHYPQLHKHVAFWDEFSQADSEQQVLLQKKQQQQRMRRKPLPRKAEPTE